MKTTNIAILTLASLLMVACTNLNEVLYDKVLMSEYGKTTTEVNTIVGGAYATLRGFSDANKGGTNCYPASEFVFFLSECASDEACIPTRGTDWLDGGRYQQIQYHTWDANNTLILSAWKYNFQGIANINGIIDQVEKSSVTPTEKENFIAELRGLRAYYYYNLLDQFGSVPLVTSLVSKGLPEKSTRAQVFKFVEDELIAVLPKLSAGVVYSKFTQNVANTLLARLYLNAQVYTGTARWQDCIDACNKVSGYSLEPNYFESFKTVNENSREIIFAIPYDHKEGTVGNYLPTMSFHYNQKFAFSPTGSYPWCANGICAKPGIYRSFDANDARRGSLLIGDQINISTKAVIMMDDGNTLTYTDTIMNFKNALQNEGARLFKYQVQADDKWERDNDWVLMRYSEVLMMLAEANYRLGANGTALPFLNQIRERAGLGNISTLTDAVLDTEWKHEFIFEGLRRTTNIRFGTFFNPAWEKTATPAYRGVYPIPQNVIDLNPNITQNPDYK